MKHRDAGRWILATLPLAAMAASVYVFSEWLFVVTRPSPTAGLPLLVRVTVLLKSELPIVLPLVALQALFSVAAAARYPRFRLIAIVPAAVVLGLLLLMLADNFTYTVFGFGILNANEFLRPIYAGLLLVFTVLAGRTTLGAVGAFFSRRGAATIGLVVTMLFVCASVVWTRDSRAEPDLTEPPEVPADAGGARQLPNVLFVGIDGVDASLLSAYGYERPTSPFLEKLREESLFFENAFANVGRTHGSLVSLLTGRLPFTTHVTFPPTILQGDDARRNLPVLLKTYGFTSLQIGMRHYADAEDANMLGFDAANYRWQRLEDIRAGEGAADETDVFRAEVADRLDERMGQLFGFRHAINDFAVVQGREESPYWSDERRVDTLVRYFRTASEPWFVHVHMLDTHCCAYRPSESVPGWSDRESVIKEADENVLRLYSALEAGGRLERTVMVIYSDHTSEWTTTGRVPLIIRFPGARAKGRIVPNVQLADVAPTVLDYLDIDAPDWMDGISLLNRQNLAEPRAIFGVSDIGLHQAVAPWLSALSASGPPNYGAASITLVTGSQWFELSLLNGVVRSGKVPGHTGVRLPYVSDTNGRAQILAQLIRTGFQILPPPRQ